MRRLSLAWDGEAFWPLSADRVLAKQSYGQGEVVAFCRSEGPLPLPATGNLLLACPARGVGEPS